MSSVAFSHATRCHRESLLILNTRRSLQINLSTTTLPHLSYPSDTTNSYAYTRLLKACLQECKLFRGRHLFDKMPERKLQATNTCKIIHAHSLKYGFGSNGYLGNAIVDLYAKCGDIDFARKTFEKLVERDVSSWNSMLSLYLRSDMVEEVTKSFGLLLECNEKPNQFSFALLLSACGRLTDIGLGKKSHCYIVKLGFEVDSFCQGALIDMYAKCNSVTDARRIFDGAGQVDTVSWTSMIAGYVRVGLPEEAVQLFSDMQRVGATPDQVAFVTVINACVGLGKLDEAVDLFNRMPEPNVVAWNVMISGHAQTGYAIEAIDYYRSMREYGVKPTRSTLGSMLSAIANLKAVEEGQQVHSEAIRMGLNSNVYVGSSLINMYAKCQMMESARNIFDALHEKNTVLWNAMLGGYAQNGHHMEVLNFFVDMRACGFQPDGFTYTSILSACACLESLDAGRQLHSFIIKNNLESNLYVGNAMVDMYAKSGDLKVARRLFELIQFRDNISWNAIIVGYIHEENEDEAFNMFRRMNFDMIVPDEVSLSSILSACANLQALEQGKEVHCFSVKSGFDKIVYAGSSLIDMYAKCGALEAANKVLAWMPEKSVVVRNALIAGYEQSNNTKVAMNLFQEMLEGPKPSKFTFASILAACSGSLKLDLGKQVHCYTLKSGVLHEDDFRGVLLLGVYLSSDGEQDAKKLIVELQNNKSNLDEYICSALVDMYAKCGEVVSSAQVFDKIHCKKNVISWNSKIVGFTKNGHGEDSLKIFDEMRHTCIEPDDITFLGVLTACSHSGMVSEGLQYFNDMITYHRIQSRSDHYACMIDMLGRGGLLKEAEDLIKDLPFEPDAMVWASLLSACRLHGDDIGGQLAAEKLIDLEPQNSSHYTLLSNIYAAAQNWDGVNKVRKSMRESRVIKLPGCSWITVGKKTELLRAGDKCHPSAIVIRTLLEILP